MPVEFSTFLAGVTAGLLGALIGIGGGVVLVPLLNGWLGFPYSVARGLSLVGVLATSLAGAVRPASRRLANYRLAFFLLAFSVPGAAIGERTLDLMSDATSERLFGVTMAVIAAVVLLRRNVRNVMPADTPDLGRFGARFFDDDTKSEKAYRLKRAPLAAVVSFTAGLLSSYIGIGGGIVLVPTLNTLCGIPLRVAAATSLTMIGVTAIPGVFGHWHRGFLDDPQMVIATSLGAIVGYQIGMRIGPRSSVRVIKTGTAILLAVLAAQYLILR